MHKSSPVGLALPLTPWNHLRRLEGDEWEAVGNDPCFRCSLPDGSLEAGWYALEVDIEKTSGPPLWPYLYPDYGLPEPEAHKIYLPFFREGAARQSGVVLFKQPIRGLRFDPAVAVCRFRMGALRLRRIGKGAAAVAMLGELARAPVSAGTRMRWAGRLLAGLVRGGMRTFATELDALYTRQPTTAARASYDAWLELYDPRTPERLAKASSDAAALAVRPVFSVVVPVYDPPERWLRKCIDSVRAQVYPDWELCIANDASPSPHVRRVLDEYAAADPRIRVVHREHNGHISACSNSALALAGGDWVALLDHDDELHPLALSEAARAIADHPRWRLAYSDEDKIDGEGRRYDPYMKSDWNYDLFLSHNCISHLGLYERALVEEVGGFREGLEGSQDWDLALRCIERLDDDQVGHIPRVLYHWRAIEGSTALAPQEKNYAHVAGTRAIQEHLDRIGSRGRVEDIPGQRGNYRVRYGLPESPPRVSIIIPTRDRVELLRACIESVIGETRYPSYEILVVDNQSRERETLDYLDRLRAEPRVRVLKHDAPFNYSAINNFAAAEAAGDLLCLLNNDITVISPDWLDEMAGHACRPGVGAVGAMLYYPNDTIQHAGVILGAHGVAAHAYSGKPRGHAGHMSRARLLQAMTAVTAACLVVSKEAFDAVGGLDPALTVAFNDVDLCLRLRAGGWRNVWTPYAELYHHESATRGYEDSPEKAARFAEEVALMRERWPDVLSHDPMYSRNHAVTDELHLLAFPPRVDGVQPPAVGHADH